MRWIASSADLSSVLRAQTAQVVGKLFVIVVVVFEKFSFGVYNVYVGNGVERCLYVRSKVACHVKWRNLASALTSETVVVKPLFYLFIF
mgnify:CR=1 FL=1